jgi:DNA polymerase III subunit beta
MKVTCPKEALLEACQAVAAAVPSNSSVPALKNFKATAAGESLHLVGYDPTAGVGIRYELSGITVARGGSCILPKDKLLAILKECGDPDVSIDAGKDAINVKAGGKFELLNLPVDEFPDFPEFAPGDQYHEVADDVLASLVKRVTFAADKKDATVKFQLKAVLWHAEKDTVRLVATDTKRLAVCDGFAAVHGAPSDPKFMTLVPLKAVEILERNLSGEGLVRVSLRNSAAFFQTPHALIYSALQIGKFPPYADIIAKTKKQAKQSITLPRESFFAKVRQAAIMTDDESCRVDMTFEPGKVTMQARGAKTGSSEIVMQLPDYDGPSIAIAYDPKYLTEFLRASGEDSVTLHIADGAKACLFSAGKAYEYLVMPLNQ